MSWKLLPAKKNFDAFRQQWDHLNKIYFNSHPLLDSRFVSGLIKFFSTDHVLLAIYENDSEELKSMVLLEPGKYSQYFTFLPDQAPIAPALIASQEQLKELFNYLPISCCYLEILCYDEKFSKLKKTSKYFYEIFHHCSTISIDIENNDFTCYWENRSRKLKQNIRRYKNKLSKYYPDNRMIIHNDNKDIRSAFSRYCELESKGWKSKIGTALENGNKQGRFYYEILNNFSVTNNASIYEFYADNTLIASRLTISNDDMLINLKTTYDENMSTYSPGRLLLYYQIEHVFKNCIYKTIEFYTNATQDQISWATDTREITHLTLYKNPVIKSVILILKKIKKSCAY